MEGDIHIIDGLPAIEAAGVPRILGRLDPPEQCLLPAFGDAYTALPESEWRETNLFDAFKAPVFDQSTYGSCVGMGSAGGTIVALQASGQPYQVVSPWYIYSKTRIGPGDSGAYVKDAMTQLMVDGVCLDELVPYGTIDSAKLSTGARQQAKRFRVLNAYRIQSWAEFGTALTKGFPVVFGITIGPRFSSLDSEGIAPVEQRSAGGHCMFAYSLRKSRTYGWCAGTRNSWGEKWGQGGNCAIVSGHVTAMLDAFAIQAVQDDPEETHTDPPVVK